MLIVEHIYLHICVVVYQDYGYYIKVAKGKMEYGFDSSKFAG